MFASEFAQLFQAVQAARRIMITATEREDGDSIAAELAVQRIIRRTFPDSAQTVHVINERACPRRYEFLPGAGEILPLDQAGDTRYDAGIVVDCGADRAGRVKPVFDGCPFRVRIDHHAVSNSGNATLEIVSTDVASTTELLFAFVDDSSWRVPLDPVLAELIFVGILCDTGSFQYDLTRPSTHRVAARLLETGFDFPATAEKVYLARSYAMKKLLGLVLGEMQRAPHGLYLWSVLTDAMMRRAGAAPEDSGDIIDELCFIHGVDVSMLFVEQPGGGVRISFRSRGGIHVGRFARRMSPSGGGHPRAAGCVLPGRLESVIPAIREELDREMREAGLLS
jgi:phosphoesterase RecJ-like protein